MTYLSRILSLTFTERIADCFIQLNVRELYSTVFKWTNV